jgi:hypothetical protein
MRCMYICLYMYYACTYVCTCIMHVHMYVHVFCMYISQENPNRRHGIIWMSYAFVRSLFSIYTLGCTKTQFAYFAYSLRRSKRTRLIASSSNFVHLTVNIHMYVFCQHEKFISEVFATAVVISDPTYIRRFLNGGRVTRWVLKKSPKMWPNRIFIRINTQSIPRENVAQKAWLLL